MITDTINTKLVNALQKQSQIMQEPIEGLQIRFSLTSRDELKYEIVNGLNEKTLTLDGLIGSNIYNVFIKKGLKGAFKKVSRLYNIQMENVWLIVYTKDAASVLIKAFDKTDDKVVYNLTINDLV